MRFARVAICALFVAGCAEAPVASQSVPPKESKGLSAAPLSSLDLGQEIDSTKGRPLRMRRITLEPGGVIGLHTHKDRPAVSYVLQGEVTYYSEGKPPVTF